MKLVPFIAGFYAASARSDEDSAYARNGFVSGEIEGWGNPDGSAAKIIIARFATSDGAVSEFDGFSGEFGLDPFSHTIFADQVNGAVGDADPQPDASGFQVAEIVDHVRDYLVDVHVYTPGPPDTADAATLLRQELKALAAARFGVTHADMPVTEANVWLAIQGRPVRTDLSVSSAAGSPLLHIIGRCDKVATTTMGGARCLQIFCGGASAGAGVPLAGSGSAVGVERGPDVLGGRDRRRDGGQGRAGGRCRPSPSWRSPSSFPASCSACSTATSRAPARPITGRPGSSAAPYPVIGVDLILAYFLSIPPIAIPAGAYTLALIAPGYQAPAIVQLAVTLFWIVFAAVPLLLGARPTARITQVFFTAVKWSPWRPSAWSAPSTGIGWRCRFTSGRPDRGHPDRRRRRRHHPRRLGDRQLRGRGVPQAAR